ncbi:carboxymuconolactone decarboxylase family protein [Domibacillus sp. A3M-37]|uniref:carboxymuconolactone decarboxylase family protein n=1 Tax=Domibacillus sp. A3M-37 TaxID=2962037 RepID=UPI0020B7D43B|nr:carboxymuconolactone decarboxylase family protein [Domibacillus sp. A3M-37]MCP3761796.1 carboxymuconolactone decarboxylase family protein [Domibacillus sp. A3M-37]
MAPDFRRWIIEAYGEIYGRPHLDKKEQALIVILSLVTQGAHTQLATHIKHGMNAGLTKEQVAEYIIQSMSPLQQFSPCSASFNHFKRDY